ncbi:MAG: AAA family ATPase [Anaerolineae bacterium]|nr:AAA family ATPase [Anaerolineae bacterium]
MAESLSPPLAEPFAQIFTDRAEADWAFDLLRDTAKRLGIQGAYDPRFAITLARRSGRAGLHLNFGGWLVLGFHGPGAAAERVDLALLAALVTWDERFSFFSFVRKESEPEVRSYHLPPDIIRPMPSELQTAYLTTLDFIAQKFSAWKRAVHWQRHNPEIAEALFKPEQRERLFAGLLTEPELRYERHLTPFYQDLSEEREEYEVEGWEARRRGREDAGERPQPEYLVERVTDMNLNQEQQDIPYNAEKRLAKPFSKIFVDRAEAEWVFDFMRDTITELGINDLNDQRFAITFTHRHNVLRLDLGNWAILSFRKRNSPKRVSIPLIANQVDLDRDFETYNYAQKSDEPDIREYSFSIDMINPLTGELQVAYKNTIDYLAKRFKNYSRCPWRDRYHVSEIAEALFNLEKRTKLLNEGLSRKIRLIEEDNDETDSIPSSFILHPSSLPYPLSQLAADTALDEAELARWVRAIERKGQTVLYGPPGTGKTFVAEKLARHLIGGGDGFWELVQFHPAYAYEDFIQGIRPESQGDHLTYPLKPGRFLEFCQRAAARQDTCVLIIDEINRANLSRVFGELMYLLEYREREIPLAGGGNFTIPANVRLIGTMNTADRSIALVDHALRRRFAFIALYPNYEVLRRYHQATGFPVEKLINLLQRLNNAIADRHYEVGVTFFLRPTLADEIEDIWRMEIEPYLEEYFFDRPETIEEFRWEKVKGQL